MEGVICSGGLSGFALLIGALDSPEGVPLTLATTRRPALLSMVVNALPGSWVGAPRAATLRVEADFVTCTQ